MPNISFKVGGISHIVKDEVNGKLFKINDNLEIIADYIIKKYKNKNEYKKLAQNSYKEYRNKFSYDKIIPKLLKNLQKNLYN